MVIIPTTRQLLISSAGNYKTSTVDSDKQEFLDKKQFSNEKEISNKEELSDKEEFSDECKDHAYDETDYLDFNDNEPGDTHIGLYDEVIEVLYPPSP